MHPPSREQSIARQSTHPLIISTDREAYRLIKPQNENNHLLHFSSATTEMAAAEAGEAAAAEGTRGRRKAAEEMGQAAAEEARA